MKQPSDTANPLPEFEQRICSGLYAKRSIWHNQFSGEMPSTGELASLTAALIRTAPPGSYEKPCADGLRLWFAAHETIALQKQCNEDYQAFDAAQESEKQKLPKAKDSEFPMTLATLCKKLWPDKDTGERAALIREWLSKGTYDGGDFAVMNRELIDRKRFDYLCPTILQWYKRRKRTTNSTARSEAGKTGAKKKKEKIEQRYSKWCKKTGRTKSDESLAQFKLEKLGKEPNGEKRLLKKS